MPTFASLEAMFKSGQATGTQPSTPITRASSVALPVPSPMVMSRPSTPSAALPLATASPSQDIAMASPTAARAAPPLQIASAVKTQLVAVGRDEPTTTPVSTAAVPSTPRAATTPLFMPELTSPTPPASSPPPYTSTPTPASRMPQPSLSTLPHRRRPALPHLRIATDRVRNTYDTFGPGTPRLPSSPLALSAYAADDDDEKDDSFGLSRLLDSPLPPSLSQMKAYADGGASELQRSIPGNSGVLASSEADVFSDDTPYLLRVDGTSHRVQLRIAEDAYASVAGGVIAVSGDGSEVSATGPQARAIAVMPTRGIAAVGFMRAGEARLNLARARPSSPPPSSPVCSDVEGDVEDEGEPQVEVSDIPGGKRKRAVLKTAPTSSPDEPKRARRVYTSAARRTREAPPPAAPPAMSTRRSGRSISTPNLAAEPARSAATSSGRAQGRAPSAASRRTVSTTYRPSPLSGLPFARPSDLVLAGLSSTTLQATALSSVAATIMLHATQLGTQFVELLGNLITIDQHVAESSFTKRLLVGRPVQVRFFAKSRRLFQASVFEEFDGTYAIRFWTWWNTLVGDMCYPAPGALRRPGRLLPDADLRALLRGGHNGFGTVVVALVIWIFGFMRSTPATTPLSFSTKPAATQVAAWSDAIAHVNYIATAMVNTLDI
jgi:hypothetical protein